MSTAESRVFWLGLVICPLIWTFFLVAALFSLKFKWLVSRLVKFLVDTQIYIVCSVGNPTNQKVIGSTPAGSTQISFF